MKRTENQSIAIQEALRILSGSTPKSSYYDIVEQLQGLMRLANWANMGTTDLDEIFETALQLRTEEQMGSFRKAHDLPDRPALEWN